MNRFQQANYDNKTFMMQWRRFIKYDLYILKDFFPMLIISVFFFVFIVIIIDFFDNLHRIDRYPMWMNLEFYAASVPQQIVEYCPFATLFAVLYTMGILARFNQITPMLMAGMSIYRIMVPLFLAGFLLSVFMFFFNDTVAHDANRHFVRIQDAMTMVRTGKLGNRCTRKQWLAAESSNNEDNTFHVSVTGSSNRVYFIDRYQRRGNRDTMSEVQIYRISTNFNRVTERIRASQAVWDPDMKQWVFQNAEITSYDDRGDPITNEQLASYARGLPETPDYFMLDKYELSEYSTRELRYYIAQRRKQNKDPSLAIIELNKKYSVAFAIFIMVILGAPLSTFSRRSVLVLSILISFIALAIYKMFEGFGLAFAGSGDLSPFLGTWLHNIIFLAVGSALVYFAKT